LIILAIQQADHRYRKEISLEAKKKRAAPITLVILAIQQAEHRYRKEI